MGEENRYQVRFSVDEERPSVEALSQMDRSVREFKFTWQRWGNWGRHNPIIAVDLEANVMVGFHAAAFGRRSGYVNSYYQFVAGQYQGHGVGAKMVDFILKQAPGFNCTRLKFKVPKVGAGRAFWEGFGLKPFGEDDHHAIFDVSLVGINEIDQLVAGAVQASSPEGIPAKVMERYLAYGVRPIAAA